MTKKVASCTVLVVAAMGHALQAQAATHCFERGDSANVSYDVLQVAAPPPFSATRGEYADTSPYYPGTMYATRPFGEASPESPSGFTFDRYQLLWANRCVYMRGITPNSASCRNMTVYKGNDSHGLVVAPPTSDGTRTALTDLRPAFSTYRKANQCTLLQTMRFFGEPSQRLAGKAAAEGLVFWDSADRVEVANYAREVTVGNGSKQTYLVDVCMTTGKTVAPDTEGIALDYEVADRRLENEVLSFIGSLNNVVDRYGKKLVMLTLPLASTNPNIAPDYRGPHGISWVNAAKLLNYVDGFMTVISSGATPGSAYSMSPPRLRTVSPIDNYLQTLDVFTNFGRIVLTPIQKTKMMFGVSLYDTQLAEAEWLQDEFITQNYKGVAIIRNFVAQGGECSRPENQVIACLTLRECDGTFGMDR